MTRSNKKKNMDFSIDIKEIATVTMVLFAVIDVVGSIPIIINLRQTSGELQSGKASLVSLAIMVVFLFAGKSILELIGLTTNDFAIAGSLVIFFIALEMILGIRLYKEEVTSTASVVPLAFPLIAGTGTLTTLLSMRAQYHTISLLIGIVINVGIVYVVLKNVKHLERILGVGGVAILRKVFGIILLAIAVKIFRTNSGI